MSWRPAPTVRNPLVALRRVVEAPEIEPLVDAAVPAATGAAVAGGAAPSGTGTVTPFPARHDAADAGGPGSTGPGGSSRSAARARRNRPRDRSPRPLPDRPVQALITSTPVGLGTTPTSPSRPAERPGPTIVAHAAAGPWSTLPEAPPSTPTLLRSSPGGPTGGSTATATGRTASVSNPVLRAIPLGPPRSPSPRPRRPTSSPHRRAPSTRPIPTAHPPQPQAPVAPTPLIVPGPAVGRKPMTVAQVTATMTAALLLWALADAPALLHGAETSPLGTRRNAALTVLRPLERVSAALGIDRLSHVADTLLHRHVTTAATPAAATPTPTPIATQPDHPAAPAKVGSGKTPRAPAPVTRLPALRVGTAANPLRVLVIGDSIGLSFGDSLANKLDGTGIVAATIDAREGTGLSRPDAFDWPAEVSADLARFRPEVVVAMFGGNDDQDTIINGRFIPFGSQAWTVIYGSRVAGLADAVHGAGAHLLWSGLPVVRSAVKSERLQAVMAVTRAALVGRDAAMFVDNLTALSDASGHYTVAITDAAGQTVIVREPDGIHVSPAGADRLADRAIGDMEAAWHLDLRPSPPTVRRGQ